MATGSEQDKTLKALQTAIQMEIDGKEYYLKASQQSGNELGKKLLKKLAAEEDIHRQTFERIYNAIRKEKAWPKTDFQPDGGRTLRTIFAQAAGQGSTKAKTADSSTRSRKPWVWRTRPTISTSSGSRRLHMPPRGNFTRPCPPRRRNTI